jgi:hypothetical protein
MGPHSAIITSISILTTTVTIAFTIIVAFVIIINDILFAVRATYTTTVAIVILAY